MDDIQNRYILDRKCSWVSCLNRLTENILIDNHFFQVITEYHLKIVTNAHELEFPTSPLQSSQKKTPCYLRNYANANKGVFSKTNLCNMRTLKVHTFELGVLNSLNIDKISSY